MAPRFSSFDCFSPYVNVGSLSEGKVNKRLRRYFRESKE